MTIELCYGAGYLGEFLFSVHVHINQPQLSQRDWKLLNKWLLGARLDDLKALSPAFKQAVSSCPAPSSMIAACIGKGG